MISKELFSKTIKNIQRQSARFDKFTDAILAISDGHLVFDDDDLYLSSLLEVLEDEFSDQDTKWISWYLWEDVDKIVWDENNNEIRVDTPELLYEFLVSELNDKSEENTGCEYCSSESGNNEYFVDPLDGQWYHDVATFEYDSLDDDYFHQREYGVRHCQYCGRELKRKEKKNED